MSQENKQSALSFLKLVVEGKIEEAYQKYVDMNGKHHNAYFPAGFQALKQAMIENHKKHPNKQFNIKNTISENDLVMVHSHIIHETGMTGVSVVHILKFKNNKIIEMWDVGQTIKEDSPNKDGPF